MNGQESIPPLVSIMVVSYNQERYIRRALQSALDQDYPNLEVVVSDDASSDATPAIIREMAESSGGKIRPLLQTRNLGITDNCNAALESCRGEYIAFMGGDDYFLPGKLTKQVEWFKQHPQAVLCGHPVHVVNEDGKPIESSFGALGQIPVGCGAGGLIREGNPFPAVSVMVRRYRLPPSGFDRRLPVLSDWKLWIDVVAADGGYGYVEGQLAAYRRHGGNVTARPSWKVTRDVLMTAWLSLCDSRGRYLQDWLHYFLWRPLRKRLYWRRRV